MKFKKQLEGLQAYKPGRTMEEVKKAYGLSEVVKLASNENPYGSSPKIQQLLSEGGMDFALYPDGYAASLRESTAKHLGVKETQLIFGNGSDEIILLVTRALLSPSVNSIAASITFSQYEHNAKIEGAEWISVPLKEDGTHDLETMLAKVTNDTAVVWICNPNNPTGTLTPSKDIYSFLERVPSDVLIVLDEAYYEYVTVSDYENSIPWIEKFPNLLVLRTFSKAYGLAAFRVGYGVGSEEVIAQLEPTREPFNNTSISQQAALLALEDQTFIQQTVQQNTAGKSQYIEFCERHQLRYYPTQTNFILIDIEQDSDRAFEYLMSKGYIVRSGAALGIPGTLRITIGTKEQNDGVLHHLEELVTKEKV
ncbi:histidinol-phosphate transaminase [Chryseomicrobium palamuruense]|uniref:Histidinol-phosphate aminotransferase n=1 Tax=Chryseomicrobium palamuruense TaxID=682973 RepID=A0ABV8UTG2_9BACL